MFAEHLITNLGDLSHTIMAESKVYKSGFIPPFTLIYTASIVKGLVRDDNTGQRWREVHRTMSLVQQTPPYGVRCGDPRSKKEKEKERMNLKLVAWLLVHRTMVAS
jgi:hypothetical protein